MKLTPMERRARIHALAEADREYQKMHAEYESGKKWFEKFTGCLPKWLSSRLWNYPGMFYLMHHRMLTLICENLRFTDEE